MVYILEKFFALKYFKPKIILVDSKTSIKSWLRPQITCSYSNETHQSISLQIFFAHYFLQEKPDSIQDRYLEHSLPMLSKHFVQECRNTFFLHLYSEVNSSQKIRNREFVLLFRNLFIIHEHYNKPQMMLTTSASQLCTDASSEQKNSSRFIFIFISQIV